jgi:hypothetical protein
MRVWFRNLASLAYEPEARRVSQMLRGVLNVCRAKAAQVIVWDRGRPARNEREARKLDCWSFRKSARLRRVASGMPAVPGNHLN